jgi:hypothetical protein
MTESTSSTRLVSIAIVGVEQTAVDQPMASGF